MAGARTSETRPVQRDPESDRLTSAERDGIGRCVRAVELALQRRCREEAEAALDRHFAPPEDDLTEDSSVFELPIELRIQNFLYDDGIETVAELRAAIGSGRIWQIPNMGLVSVKRCMRAVEQIGIALDWQI